VRGATPLAIATAAIPAATRGECLRRNQTTAPFIEKGATAENRSLIGSISITTTTYSIIHDCNVFPSAKSARPISNMAMIMTLLRMGRGDFTVHGFRSTFSDWCAERTSFPSEVREMAPAHTVSDKVEAAYRRGDLFQKRRDLMDAWARFAGGETNVVRIEEMQHVAR
jgi:hypothetical protein